VLAEHSLCVIAEPSVAAPSCINQAAHAYMECEVASRMEAGDHYVVYATVLDGAVTDEAAQTAVHHRKVANHY
jgi:flavin reductase (DIM6/NTAB) family NADH-FMN oxidoreductase RutF